jgi:hypothetical protein
MNSPLQFIADTGYLYQSSVFLIVEITGAFCKLYYPMYAKQSETIKTLPITY